jgi:tripartite-type tricarboxylate transporter receptor subunit TctC
VRVFYKGPAAAMTDLISGQVQLMFVAAASGMPHVKTGRLRALAITTASPSALAPGMPTVAASGLPGYESILTLALFAPAATPAPIISRLNQEMVRILKRDDIKEKLLNTGAEIVAGTPEQCMAVIKADISKWGRIIKDAGIRD